MDMMEAMTALTEIDVAEASSHLFHVIMQAPISPAFPYFCKQRASCLAIYCAYQWKDALPRCRVRCLRVVNQMSYLTVGSLENTSRLVDVSLNWTINSTG